MNKYCGRYMDDYPGVRAACKTWLEGGGKCEDCRQRNVGAEVVALRAEVEAKDAEWRLQEQLKDKALAEVSRLRAEVLSATGQAQQHLEEVERLTKALQKWAPLCSCGCYSCCELSDVAEGLPGPTTDIPEE